MKKILALLLVIVLYICIFSPEATYAEITVSEPTNINNGLTAESVIQIAAIQTAATVPKITFARNIATFPTRNKARLSW